MTEDSQAYPVPNDFYRAFEDRFRGSQELIAERLEAYMPFLRALQSDGQVRRGLDLGCGRGEWLRLLEREGFEAHGVDLDDGMLHAAIEQGLSVENKDAIAALVEAEDASLDVISGFHIIEHIPFPSRLALIREACRVLRPGGLLILETPNPENPLVGTYSFYMDPTHISPIPPIVMPFLASYAGFFQSTILRLHTPPPSEAPKLVDVFTKVGTDYALVARTEGGPNPLMDEAFETSVGLDILDALLRFDDLMEKRFSNGADVSAALKVDIENARAEHQAMSAMLEDAISAKMENEMSARMENIRAELSEMHRRLESSRSRPFMQRMFFSRSGRPRKWLRRLAFHKNGRPREGGLRGRIARKKNGSVRPVFEKWMNTKEYASLPWPSNRANHAEMVNTTAAPPIDQTPASPPPPDPVQPPSPQPPVSSSQSSPSELEASAHPRRYEVLTRLASAQRREGK